MSALVRIFPIDVACPLPGGDAVTENLGEGAIDDDGSNQGPTERQRLKKAILWV